MVLLRPAVISTQQEAVCLSANGEVPIGSRVASPETRYAETLPAFAPACAFETYSSDGSVGRNWLPNGPTAWAGKGEPGAGVSRPSSPTMKLSMNDGPLAGPTSVPTSFVPVELKSTSPGNAVANNG